MTAVFDFDEEFQTLIAALVLRDQEFNALTEGLLKPDYFSDQAQQVLVFIALQYFAKYRRCPTTAVLAEQLKDAREKKIIRSDMWEPVKRALRECLTADISDRAFAVDKVATFARHRAVEAAILEAAETLDKGQFDKIETAIKRALSVGINEDNECRDLFGRAAARAEIRADILAGKIKRDGITTGHPKIDSLLYHGGWGRREFTLLMAPAKGGKSMALIQFAVNAHLAGYSVLYVTLEVSADIVEDRCDACISGVTMDSLIPSAGIVRDRVEAAKRAGAVFETVEFASGTLTPNALRKLLEKRKQAGQVYDMVCVDYADLMSPNRVFDDPRENSRTIYVDLRAIAQDFNLALLSATQTNREGFKAAVGRMEHVAEDINKVRTVDLLVSINATDDEKARGECRLYFAASRNQKGNLTVRLKGDMSKARIAETVLSVEE